MMCTSIVQIMTARLSHINDEQTSIATRTLQSNNYRQKAFRPIDQKRSLPLQLLDLALAVH